MLKKQNYRTCNFVMGKISQFVVGPLKNKITMKMFKNGSQNDVHQ